MTRIVAALEADSLVEREPVPGDKRAARIRITETGRRMVEQGRRSRTARLAEQLQALSAGELALIEQASFVLEGVVARLQDTPPGPPPSA